VGFELLPPNLPLPTKIVTQVLEPVDVRAEFGDDPDPQVVDAHIRKLMQSALDELARHRRPSSDELGQLRRHRAPASPDRP
jgi:hypothetical protein